MPPTHPLRAPRATARTGPRLAAASLAVVAALALLCALAFASSAGALEQRISVGDTDLLGYAIAVDGDTLVLGAPFDADKTGAAYVYRRTR
jgi:hypothetical protein